jgi:hypothetical protein
LLGGATVSTGQTFTIVIDPDTALEEVVDIYSPSTNPVSGNNLTIVRGVDGSSAQDHSAGAVVRHMIIGRDLREANTHIEASAAVHGLAGTVVGTTDAQALTNKDLSSATNTLSTSVVTLTGTQTLTNKTITSASETTPTIAGATISGTWTSTATITGGTMNPTTLTQNSVPVLTTTSTSTVTNKTLTSPIINGGTVSSATVTSSTVVSGTLGSDLAAGGYKVSGLATPTATADAATKGYVDTSISNLVASAPSTLDTLNELAAALGNDASFSTTITTSIGTKLSKSGGTMTGAIAMGTSKITGMGDPTAAQDAATKNYIDTLYGSTVAAATSAASAAASATAAATSATSAATQATAAATSATSAAASATAAATSATSSSTYATNSGNSATAAATSATSAAASATAAATSAASAATQATNASASATAAATSATSANASATAAATSATSSATSATSSANSASAALTSANSAATSATSSATSATSSATTYNTYKTYYLGTFASAPSLDNQGNALINGATYFNSATNTMYVYSTGTTTWTAISTTGYSAPTIGSTTIGSGATVSTLTSVNLATSTVSADPTTALGIASKQYVDGVAAGLNAHDSVQVATTSAIVATYTAGSTGADGGTGVGATLTVTATGVLVIDGYTTVLNDRVLIKDQTLSAQNGIYKVTLAGAIGVSAILTRATDYDNHIAGQVFAGDTVFIINGSINVTQGWVMNQNGTSTTPVKGIKIGTDNITWTQYTGVGDITAGTGILKSGNTLSIDTAVVDTLTGTQTLTNKTLTSPTINGATLTGTLTAGATSGTNGYYLQSTNTGVQWAAVAGYSAPTLGSTSIGSGATVTTINGLTKIQSQQHTQLDANSYEQDIALMTLMGAWL